MPSGLGVGVWAQGAWTLAKVQRKQALASHLSEEKLGPETGGGLARQDVHWDLHIPYQDAGFQLPANTAVGAAGDGSSS